MAILILNYHNYLWRELNKQAQIEYYGHSIPGKFMDSVLMLSDEQE